MISSPTIDNDQRQQESQEIATLLLPPHQHIQTVSHLLWSYIYNFDLAGAYIRSRASTCSQPTIGLQREVANASNMLDTSPWRKKLSRQKIVELQYLRVRYLHHGCLLMITTAHHKVTAVLLCRLDLYLTNQHQAMASSSNSKHCSPPELTKNLPSG